ncbi:hypothetical protein ACEPAI_8507 [Sanghuangporus weigelae]
MASLLERIDVGASNGSSGPVRNRGGRASSAPYDKEARLGQSRADKDTVWRHDKYVGPGKTLGSRLSDASTTPRVNTSGAVTALRQAIGLETRQANLSIKGASSAGPNVVQVDNLAKGTTAADVEAIFKSCGPIIEAHVHGPTNAEKVTVRIKYKRAEDAKNAAAEFNGKSADGNKLVASVIGSASTSLGGRFGDAVIDGKVDVLMEDASEESGGSKMRSDELLNDPRAQILTVPPGIDPAEYERRGSWRGRGRGRPGRGAGRRMRRNGSSMLVD